MRAQARKVSDKYHYLMFVFAFFEALCCFSPTVFSQSSDSANSKKTMMDQVVKIGQEGTLKRVREDEAKGIFDDAYMSDLLTLAQQYEYLDQKNLAEETLLKAKKAAETNFSPKSIYRLQTALSLSVFYVRQNKNLDVARMLLQQVIIQVNKTEISLAEQQRIKAAAFHSLSTISLRQGNLKDAEDNLKQAGGKEEESKKFQANAKTNQAPSSNYAIKQNPESNATQSALGTLNFQVRQAMQHGCPEMAEKPLVQLNDLQIKTYGKKIGLLSSNLNTLASINMQKNDLAKAESYYRQEIDYLTSVGQLGQPAFWKAENDLAYCLHLEKKDEQSEALYKEALSRCEQMQSKTPMEASMLMTLLNYADYLYSKGRNSEAIAIERRASVLLKEERFRNQAQMLDGMANFEETRRASTIGAARYRKLAALVRSIQGK